MARRIRWHFRSLFWACVVGAWVGVPFLAMAKESSSRIAGWIRQLDDDDYEVRERAEQSLLKAGIDAVDPLAEAATKANAEVAWRCAETLSRLALEGDEATLTRVIDAANRGASKGHPGFKRLADTLNQQRAIFFHQRAVVTLQKHGATVFDPLNGDARGAMAGGVFMGPVVIAAPMIVEEEEAILLDDPLEPAMEEGELEEDEPRAADPLEAEAPPAEDVPLPAEDGLPPLPEVPDADPPALEPKAPELEDEPMEIGEDAIPIPVDIDIEMEEDDFDIEDDVIDAFGGTVQRGTTLALSQNWNGTAETLRVVRHLLNFANLSIADSSIDDASIESLASAKQLRVVVIDRCPGLTGKCLKTFAKMESLESFQISGIAATAEELRAFRKSRPNIQLFCKGPGVMGVMAQLSGPCVLDSVQPNTGAAEAGLRPGDRIERIDGQRVTGFADLTVEVYGRKPGDTLKVEFERNGESQTVEVKLRPREDGGRVPLPFRR